MTFYFRAFLFVLGIVGFAGMAFAQAVRTATISFTAPTARLNRPC